MARRFPLTLALLLSLSPAALDAKAKGIQTLEPKTLVGFTQGEPPAIVWYSSRGDEKKSKYEDAFDAFCAGNRTVRCGVFDVDKDYGALAGERNTLIGTPHAVFYDATGKELGRLSGPQPTSAFAAKAAEVYRTTQ